MAKHVEHTFTSPLAPGDRVEVDGTDELRAQVLTVGWDLRGIIVEVSWWAQEGAKSQWLALDRLKLIDA